MKSTSIEVKRGTVRYDLDSELFITVHKVDDCLAGFSLGMDDEPNSNESVRLGEVLYFNGREVRVMEIDETTQTVTFLVRYDDSEY